MLLQLHFHLPGLGDYETPSVCVCVCVVLCACLQLSHFYINLYILFIYDDIFTKFAKNVYGSENMSKKFFLIILKNKMSDIANCLKILNMF